MTKEDIMVCKMIGKIGEKWVVSLHEGVLTSFRGRIKDLARNLIWETSSSYTLNPPHLEASPDLIAYRKNRVQYLLERKKYRWMVGPVSLISDPGVCMSC
jgi:hypothetical protein